MNVGDIVIVIDSKSVPEFLLGCYGIVKDGDDYKVLVEFKGAVKDMGSLSHTAYLSDLKKIGEASTYLK